MYSYFILIVENSKCGPQKLLMMPSISFIDSSIKRYSTSGPVVIHLVAKSLLYISTSDLHVSQLLSLKKKKVAYCEITTVFLIYFFF